jgi:hypothetical protein
MKNLKAIYSNVFLVMLMFGLLFVTFPALAQDEDSVLVVEDDGNKPVRQHFESSWLIDNQTCLVPQ